MTESAACVGTGDVGGGLVQAGAVLVKSYDLASMRNSAVVVVVVVVYVQGL